MDADEAWRQQRAVELFGAVPVGGNIGDPGARGPAEPLMPAPRPPAAPVGAAPADRPPQTPIWRIALAVVLLIQGGAIVWLLLGRSQPRVVVVPAAVGPIRPTASPASTVVPPPAAVPPEATVPTPPVEPPASPPTETVPLAPTQLAPTPAAPAVPTARSSPAVPIARSAPIVSSKRSTRAAVVPSSRASPPRQVASTAAPDEPKAAPPAPHRAETPAAAKAATPPRRVPASSGARPAVPAASPQAAALPQDTGVTAGPAAAPAVPAAATLDGLDARVEQDFAAVTHGGSPDVAKRARAGRKAFGRALDGCSDDDCAAAVYRTRLAELEGLRSAAATAAPLPVCDPDNYHRHPVHCRELRLRPIRPAFVVQ